MVGWQSYRKWREDKSIQGDKFYGWNQPNNLLRICVWQLSGLTGLGSSANTKNILYKINKLWRWRYNNARHPSVCSVHIVCRKFELKATVFRLIFLSHTNYVRVWGCAKLRAQPHTHTSPFINSYAMTFNVSRFTRLATIKMDGGQMPSSGNRHLLPAPLTLAMAVWWICNVTHISSCHGIWRCRFIQFFSFLFSLVFSIFAYTAHTTHHGQNGNLKKNQKNLFHFKMVFRIFIFIFFCAPCSVACRTGKILNRFAAHTHSPHIPHIPTRSTTHATNNKIFCINYVDHHSFTFGGRTTKINR